MKLKKGTSLQKGEYIIERTLGQGGFGITYLAHQQSLDRKVAIKEFFMSDNCQRDEADGCRMVVPTKSNQEFVAKSKAKFLSEARFTAALQHPNVVTIFAIFEENDTVYYVMEYLQYGSLEQLAKDRALSESESLYYVLQVADALNYMHSKSQMHLDVKPANIMLRDESTAVLIDFGLTKQFDAEGHQLTSTRRAFTPRYAPIEQQSGVREFAPRIDIYSLGATLYFLLTGENPPLADEVFNYGLPALPQHISNSTRKAVVSAMQPKAKDRPASMRVFIDMLPTAKVDSKSQSKPKANNKKQKNTGGDTVLLTDNDKSTALRGLMFNKKLLIAVLVSGLTALVIKLLLSLSSPANKLPSMTLDEAISKNSGEQLLAYAEMDSSRAFYPLARYYFIERKESKAEKYAIMALEARQDTIKAAEVLLGIEGHAPSVADMMIDDIIKNLPQDANLVVDELVKAIGQVDEVNNKAESLGLNYEYSHEQLDKLVDKHYKQWVKAGNASPIPEVKRNCYNTALRLKPNGSEALTGLRNTYNK